MIPVPRITGTINGPSGPRYTLFLGDVMDGLSRIKPESVHVVVTSIPYWQLRDYGFDGQLGLEKTPEEFIANMVKVFGKSGVWRVLRRDGVLWLNVGDTFTKDSKYGGVSGSKHAPHAASNAIPRGYGSTAGLPNGNKILIPYRLALALQADGWILRQDNIWAKPSPMPESIQGCYWQRCRVKVADVPTKFTPCPGCNRCIPNGGFVLRRGSGRCTTSHEFMFQFVKSDLYFYDADSSKEPTTGTANPRGKGVNPKAAATDLSDGRNLKSKANHAFSGACNQITETRLLRSVWHIASEGTKVKHFAAYPTEMVRRPLSTTISRGGCCATCVAQYAPVVVKHRVATRPGRDSKTTSFQDRIGSRPDRPNQPNIVGNRDPQRHTTISNVIGYRKTCECPGSEKSRPVVLDPFVGTGTTLQVALRMGADAIGIDAKPEYLQIAQERAETDWIPVPDRKAKKRKRVTA